MYKFLLLAFTFSFFVSCRNKPVYYKHACKADSPIVFFLEKTISFFEKKKKKDYYTALDIQLLGLGLIDVRSIDTSFVVQLKYAGVDNFTGKKLYENLFRAYLQPSVAVKLKIAQIALQKDYPNYKMMIFDAARPLHIQQLMWDSVYLTKADRCKYLSNPAKGSLHNYGAAVDVTIVNEKGIELDMGTAFDFFGEEAQPDKEQLLFDSGRLSKGQLENRYLLRKVMKLAGFSPIASEWWHFNACTRVKASQTYKIIP